MAPFKKRLTSIERHIVKNVSRAIIKFNLIENGEKILIAHSGGKDSWALLHFLSIVNVFAPIKFKLGVVILNQGVDRGVYTDVVNRIKKDYTDDVFLIDAPIFNIVREKNQPGKIPCSLCARLRRGFLFRVADKMGYHKVALGHHKDDFVETLLLNLFFNARFEGITPRLEVDMGTVIRPLVYVRERDIARFVKKFSLPVVEGSCPLLSEYSGLSNRDLVKWVLRELEKKNKHVINSIFNAYEENFLVNSN